ncbi:hypothetical protein [Paractinoplanes hotanensis]|uniref:Gram-positive cocci surface proteins LPxTG domain-containing protein n=1 Tax=Paractinoplanes hotanensis TaxID=2906497 RepID=A0ABT0Y032_9ACTN|nr:hypothetical protein [Actinoplanes hotanensis]MCM4079393.1 hypothetical protein [Actinoplanes hotanensis]
MTPARSLAASVVALGFASALTAPQPALAAPAPCERAENFAAQSGAEMLRIDKLEVRAAAPERPRFKNAPKTEKGTVGDAANRVLSRDDDPTIPNPEDSDTISEGIGLTGMGVLGYLGTLPKSAAKTTGDADVVPTPKKRPAGEITERGGAVADGLSKRTDSGGAGGGEPVPEEPADSDEASDRRSQNPGGSHEASDRRSQNPGGSDEASDRPSQTPGGSDASSDQRSQNPGGGDGRVKSASLAEVGLGEARTAMIAESKIALAAYARMLNGAPAGKKYAAMVKPLLQQAPPTNAKASRRSTPAGKAGPLRLGRGGLGTHAQWDAAMACGRAAGETGRADASLTSLSVLNDLVRVPGAMTSRGTTALERRGDEARTVARSTVTAGRIELAGGQVQLRVLQAPVLEAAMSAGSGGKVSYRPAVVEISGDGVQTRRLKTAGEHVDIALNPQYHEMESARVPSLTELGRLGRAEPLPVPAVPGLPSVPAPTTESAPAATDGIRLRVALGDVRHAVKGQAIAARASAIKVSLTRKTSSKARGQDGYGAKSGVSLTMSLGVLEAAAVSPEAQQITSSGAGGGLPVTGSDVTRVALAGGGLLLAGVVAILLTVRRRRTHS